MPLPLVLIPGTVSGMLVGVHQQWLLEDSSAAERASKREARFRHLRVDLLRGVLGMNIYVGNLSYNTDDDGLRNAFAEFGEVASTQVIKDKDTGRSRGFGFVEMPDQAAAEAAIKGLNGKEVDGRALSVNEARPKPDRGDRGGDRGARGESRW